MTRPLSHPFIQAGLFAATLFLAGCGGDDNVVICIHGQFNSVDSRVSFVEPLPKVSSVMVQLVDTSNQKVVSAANSSLPCDLSRNSCTGVIATAMTPAGRYTLNTFRPDMSPLGSVEVDIRADSSASCATLLNAVVGHSNPAQYDATSVSAAVSKLDGIVQDALVRTGVPGMAVGVVYQDKVIYAKGFGVREVGQPGQIDADTVFMLASLSKPIASTVVAKLVGDGLVHWDDPARKHNPGFRLSDPHVTEMATLGDLLSHRSGLHTGAGDLLEDLGFSQDYILSRLYMQPLDSFRTSYNYSNFGYTLGGVSAAMAANTPWEQLADEVLFQPAGMTRSSYRHADYLAHPDRARIHVRLDDGRWVARYDRQPDAEAPAGGASASLSDMLRFARLQLGEGVLDGRRVIDASALAATHIAAQPDPEHSYGYGWNVSHDTSGRVRIGHSGAFNLGTATNILLLPSDELGIVTLTNGQLIGVAEAIGQTFLDVLQHGHQTTDWISLIGAYFDKMKIEDAPKVDYSQRPASPRPPRSDAAYVGQCSNPYYGTLDIRAGSNGLSMTLGPVEQPTTFALSPFDGDTFSFETIGENANGLAGAIFSLDGQGKAREVVLDYYDVRGLGRFNCP